MLNLPTTNISEMFDNPQFDIEVSGTPTLEAMEADLAHRIANGERWEVVIVEESKDYVSAGTAKRGMMLLRRKAGTLLYTGLHYPRADCGADHGAVGVTSRMLCLLLGRSDTDRFYEDFFRYYSKVIAWDLDTDQPQIEPID